MRKAPKSTIVAAFKPIKDGFKLAKTFKIGDVVRLVSGGLWMTVEGFDEENKNIVRCKWFDGPTRHEQAFEKKQIMHHPGPATSPA